MKTKICTKCGVEKLLSEFYFRKDNNSYRNECKECLRLFNIQYYNNNKQKLLKHSKEYQKLIRFSKPWYKSFDSAKERCNNRNCKDYHRYGGRGIKFSLTEDEVKELWFRDKAYLMKQHSIDRIDNDGNYEYNNCRFIELGENNKKRHITTPNHKIVLQFNKNGTFIKEWFSIIKASLELNINMTSIANCANNRKSCLTAGGFIWRFK